MREIVIDRPTNEASALLTIRNSAILEAQGWDRGFWTCSDEARVERALGALGRRADGRGPDDGWELCRPAKVKATVAKKTEDCEAMARRGDWVYVFGSHFGLKTGPLKPRRHFVARFNEAQIDGKLETARIEMEIARGTFKLHRLLNDAFRSSGLELIERGDREARKAIQKTLHKGKDQGKKWADRILEEDWSINIEGVEFRDAGSLLLGLRYPVTRDGHPILAEIDDIDKLFLDPPEEPLLLRFWVIGNVGTTEEPRGVRALERDGRWFHAITGNLDSDPEESVLVQDHPAGAKAPSRHHRFRLPHIHLKTLGRVKAELVGDVDGETKIEGLAIDGDGSYCYVLDDERIRLRCAERDKR